MFTHERDNMITSAAESAGQVTGNKAAKIWRAREVESRDAKEDYVLLHKLVELDKNATASATPAKYSRNPVPYISSPSSPLPTYSCAAE